MEFPKNEWSDFTVQGIKLGRVMHVYEETVGDKHINLRNFGYLVQTDVQTVNEYYCISIDSRFTGIFSQSISLNKDVFEKLVNSKFTRVIDYFVMARDVIAVDETAKVNKAIAEYYAQKTAPDEYSGDNDDDYTSFSITIKNEGEIDNLAITVWKRYSLQ